MSGVPPVADLRLAWHRDPLRLVVCASPWLAARYLASYLALSWMLFAAAVVTAVTAGALAFTVLAFPLLLAAAAVLHGCADVERLMLRQVLREPVRASYQQATAPGPRGRAVAAWRDLATWHEVGYLAGLWVPLYVLDAIVLSVWVTLLAGITLPAWYWAPPEEFGNGQRAHGVQLGYFPNGPHGAGGHGLFVDTLPKALLAAAGFLILFLLFNYVLLATARMHARVARSLLSPASDPLAMAKEVLAGPGPLGPLRPTSS